MILAFVRVFDGLRNYELINSGSTPKFEALNFGGCDTHFRALFSGQVTGIKLQPIHLRSRVLMAKTSSNLLFRNYRLD